MSAIRLARGATGRDLLVKFEGCYHGHSDALLAKGAGSGVATLGIPGSPGVTEGAAKDTITAPFNDLGAVRSIFAERGADVAVVIVEPIAANMGVVPPEDGFLEGLRDLCDEHGALLCFDEVITGFRVAYGGAGSLYGVTPDLTTLGKIMGGGFPCAAFGGRRDADGTARARRARLPGGHAEREPRRGRRRDRGAWTSPRRSSRTRRSRRLSSTLADGLAERFRAAGIPVTVNRAESMFSVFFTDRPVRNFDDAKARTTNGTRASSTTCSIVACTSRRPATSCGASPPRTTPRRPSGRSMPRRRSRASPPAEPRPFKRRRVAPSLRARRRRRCASRRSTSPTSSRARR